MHLSKEISLHLPLADIENGLTVVPMLLNPSALSVSCLFLSVGRQCTTWAAALFVIETGGLRSPCPKNTNYKTIVVKVQWTFA